MNWETQRQTEPPDRIEIWARRTGRALGFAVLFGLAVYLLFTYGGRG